MYKYDKEIETIAINPMAFSPVVVKGKTGNGKSTFLHKFSEKRSEVYKSAFSKWNGNEALRVFNAREIFESIIEAISNVTPKAWQDVFMPYDVLVIDDFDAFADKPGIQEELFSYFLVCKKAIVIATAQEIREPYFSAELSSFFASAVRIYIDDPDREAKSDFLFKELSISGLSVEKDALVWLFNQTFSSYAAVKGFVKSLMLFKSDVAYTLDTCQKIAKDYIS
ncbi:MAG: hypothetical protein E7673_06505 [Ruminococcaceae bacterium]|nr:hypothetical protein [Oscillospiraceae bacterium]